MEILVLCKMDGAQAQTSPSTDKSLSPVSQVTHSLVPAAEDVYQLEHGVAANQCAKVRTPKVLS